MIRDHWFGTINGAYIKRIHGVLLATGEIEQATDCGCG